MPSVLRRAADAIPTSAKPPLAVVLNITLTTLLAYLASPWIADDLRNVTRPMKSLSDYSALLAWRTVEILGYWVAEWDATQATALSMVSLAPLLHYFHTYQPSYSPVVPGLSAPIIINMLSVYLPLRFLRASKASRRPFLDQTRFLASLLTSSIYQLVLQAASARFLTTWLIGSGWDLESVARAHSTTEAMILVRAAMMLPMGAAVADIIFFSHQDEREVKREGELEGLIGWVVKQWMTRLAPRTRRLIKRSLLVATYQAAGVTVIVAQTVKGGNLVGAAGMSGVWAVATAAVGVVLGWVGRV